MDPIAVSTAFASIIGLIGAYKSESSGKQRKDFDQYIDWLRRKEYGHLVELILGNAELTSSVRDLIEDKHDEVMAKLESLVVATI